MQARIPHILAFCLVAVLYALGALEFLENRLFDARFHLLERPSRSDLVIVAIDPISISEFGVWPWPRERHADLIDQLLDSGAKRIAFDIDFSSRSTELADQRLASALEGADRRVTLPVFRQISRDAHGENVVVETVPLPEFARHVRLASINVRPERDGMVRRMSIGSVVEGDQIPSLSVALAGEGAIDREPFYIDYGIDISMIPRVSFVDALLGQFDAEMFVDKTVLVGSTAVELGDFLSVPIHMALPGVLIQAAAYESLVQNRALERLPAILILALALALAIFAGPAFIEWGWRRGGLVALNVLAGLFVMSLVLQKIAPISFDVVPTMLVCTASYGLALVSVIDRQTWRLFAEGMSVVHRRATLQAVVDHSFDGILIVDGSGLVRSLNPAGERMLGCRESDVLGQPISLFLPFLEEVEEGSRTFLEETAGDVIAGSPAEFTARRITREEFPAEISVSRMELALGSKTLERRLQARWIYLITIRDITERKHAEQLKNDFISTASHELRTPLTSIGGALGLLTGGAAGDIPVDAMRLLRIAKNNSDRLVRLINDMLDLERIETGAMRVRREPVVLFDVLDSAIVENQGYGDGYDVTFKLIDCDPDVVVFADTDRLSQVMANLLSNAAKFSPRKSTVEISTWRRGNMIRVGVSDRGPGVPEEFRDRIFAKFSQADTSDSRQRGGTGLGLSIVKAFIEAMGGSVSFESAPDNGTTFYFDLPLWHAEATDASDNVVTLDGRRDRAAS